MAIIPDFKPVSGNQSAEVPSLGSVMAAGKAMQAVGQDISSSGQQVADAFQRKQARDDQAAENELRLVAQKAASEHQLFREQNLDESTWEGNRAGLYSQVKEAASKANVSPQKRKELDLMVQSWDVESKLETATMGERQKSSRQRTTTTRLIRAYEDAGKWDDATAARKKAVEAGIYHPEEGEVDQIDADFRKQQADVRDMATKYELGAMDDPVQVIEILSAKGENGFINDPQIDEGTRATLIRGAERELSRKRADELDTIKGAIDRNEVTAEEIQSLPMFLTDEDKKNLTAYRKRLQPPTEAEDRKAWDLIAQVREAYHAAKDGNLDEVDYRNNHRDVRGAILNMIPKGYSGPLMETLQRYSPARIYDMEMPDTAEDVKKDSEVEIRATMRAYEESGIFGKAGDDATPLEKEKAARKRRDLERTAIVELSKEKDITPQKAREIADRIAAGKVSAAGANVLRNALPGAGMSMRAAPVMPSLPPKQSAKDKQNADPLQVSPGSGGASDAVLPPKITPEMSRLNSAIQ